MPDPTPTSAAALISYRRADSQNLTERVGERLTEEFGKEAIFIDTEDIPFGTPFDQHIRASLEQSSVVLAMIGHSWLDPSEGSDTPRLFEEHDFVRRELEWARENSIAVLPVLLDGAKMPAKEQLPESIRFLTDLNAVDVRPGGDFLFTSFRLVRHLQSHHGFPKPNETFPWEAVLYPVGILMTLIGLWNSVLLVDWVTNQSTLLSAGGTSDWVWRLILLEFLGPLFLGAGPVLIVVANRICCMKQVARRRPTFLAGLETGRVLEPQAMWGFTLGFSSIGWGFLGLLPALYFSVCGILSIRRRPSLYRGYQYAIVGLVVACLGASISYVVQRSAWNLYLGHRALDRASFFYESGSLARAESEVLAACDRLPLFTEPYLVAARIFLAQLAWKDAQDAATIVIEDLESNRSAFNFNLRPTSQSRERLERETESLLEAYEIRAAASRELGGSISAAGDLAKAKQMKAELLEIHRGRGGRLGQQRPNPPLFSPIEIDDPSEGFAPGESGPEVIDEEAPPAPVVDASA